jgi:hypothetical protein
MTIERTEDPSTHGQSRHDWNGLAAAGRSEPGTWFRMPITNRSYATHLKAGQFAAFRDDADHWEATTRVVDGQLYIYVRYHTQ